jgi:hypothetical protein
VDEQLEAAEHVEEDKKPFDAATSLLIFHNGQVYVREDRDVVVENGGRALIRDLPSSVHPASLNFRSFTDSDASIVEHTYVFLSSFSSFCSTLTHTHTYCRTRITAHAHVQA